MSDIHHALTSSANQAARIAVEDFYRREILILQERRYSEWLGLMDESILYRVPVTVYTDAGLVVEDNALGYYDEDLTLLKARVQKLESRKSWVENPPSRLRYFVQVIDLEINGSASVSVRSNLLLFQHRWNVDQRFSGERHDILVAGDDGLRVKERTVVMDRQAFTQQGLSVFF